MPKTKKSADHEQAGLTWLSVVQTYQTCQRRYEELLAMFGLTLAQFDALNAIDRLGEHALPKNIADTLVVTRGNVSGLLKRLSAGGLVHLKPHPDDGRAWIVRLTAVGEKKLKRAQAAARRFVTAQMQPFDMEKQQTTRHIMQAMQSHLRSLDVHAIGMDQATESDHRGQKS